MPGAFDQTRAGPCASTRRQWPASRGSIGDIADDIDGRRIVGVDGFGHFGVEVASATWQPARQAGARFRSPAQSRCAPVTMAAWSSTHGSLPARFILVSVHVSPAPAARLIELLDQAAAMIEHRALVDRPLSVTSPRSSTGACDQHARLIRFDEPCAGWPATAERSRNAARIRTSDAARRDHRAEAFGLSAGSRRAEINQRRYLVAVECRNQRHRGPAAHRPLRSAPATAGADPVPLRVLKSSACGRRSRSRRRKSSGSNLFSASPKFVKPSSSEGLCGQFGCAPIALRDVRPLARTSSLPFLFGSSFASLPSTGSPQWPERPGCGGDRHDER